MAFGNDKVGAVYGTMDRTSVYILDSFLFVLVSHKYECRPRRLITSSCTQ